MNNPLLQMYGVEYGRSYEQLSYIQSRKKLRKNVTNTVLRNDYLGSAKV